jgi:hypothetical protein
MDTGANLFNQVAEEQVFEGSNVYMNNFVPDIGMSDLLLSVFKMFNLYVTVDPLDETNLIIETRDTYYNGGTIRDWSHKLAKDQPVIVKPLGLLTAKEYIYTYSDDGDYYNKRFEDLRGYNYGRSRTEIDNDFINSTTKVEIDFSPTPLVNDGVTSRIIPKVYDEDISTGAKPVDMNTRVLYFDNTLVSNPSWILRYNGGNNTAPKSTYPYAGHWDNPITPSLDLNFGIPTQLFYTENGYTGTLQVTNANLVNVYHRGYLNEITNKDSKVLSASFYLDAWDIAKLDFRDQILLDNSYWRLNKVTDYNPFKESLTKVELIKVLDVIQTPVETFRLGEKGADSYGEKLPVTNIKERLGRNLFNPFTGMVNGTGNKVNDSASAFKIVGDNNYIGSASKNVTITGNNNQVLFGASNVVIINSDNVVVGESDVVYLNNYKQVNCRIQCASLTIASADVLQLNSKPKQFGISVPSGYAARIISLDGKIVYGSSTYATNGNLVVRCVGTSSPQGGWTGTQFLFATTSRTSTATLTSGTSATSNQLIDGADLEVFVETGNPTAGDSEITVYVLYRIISV